MKGKQLFGDLVPNISSDQLDLLERYVDLLLEVNQQVNVISRKNTDRVWEEHLLHSLSIAMVTRFKPGTKVLDVGTGGGLPGIPLAILNPEAEFLLIDSIGKKVRVVREMARNLGLSNVRVEHVRAEDVNDRFDFVVSRAVTALPKFVEWIKGKINRSSQHDLKNGLIYIKGGDFEDELKEVGRPYRLWEISDWFDDPFFETKKVVWIDVA